MRAFALESDELVLALADVGADTEAAVRGLNFERRGALFVRRFRADAPYAHLAAERFEQVAARMVRQAARLEPVPWEDALELVHSRAPDGWWLAGSAALAVRGLAVEPRDVDVISDADGCARLAEALADVLVEPLVDGEWLGERWFRAFAHARIECAGGVAPQFDDSEVGREAAAALETVEWRGRGLRVPPLELQLRTAERRGLTERVELIREALA